MKLLRKWKDTKYGVENFLYEDKNGLQVLHTLNKQSLDTYASIILKAGSYFEKDLNVPNGTAHFLEHMIFKPNKDFKTRKDIDIFEFGSKEKAQIHTNAATAFKYMYVYGFCNSNRELDLFKRLKGMIDYPTEKFSKYINLERKVILAELKRKLKPEKDPDLQLTNFQFKGKVHNDDFSILGYSDKNIKSIKPEHLSIAHKALFTSNNAIFTIQSPNEITPEALKYINQISAVLKKNGEFNQKIYKESFDNKKEYGYFFNTETQGIKTFLFRFRKDTRKVLDYKKELLENVTVQLIRYVAFEELREKKGYIYAVRGAFEHDYSWDYFVRGFEITTDIKNLKAAVNGLNSIIQKGAIKFIMSKQGIKWLENWISGFIYPHTPGYIEDYTETLGISMIKGHVIWEFEKAKKAAMQLTVQEIANYIEKEYLVDPFYTWIDTSEDIEKIKNIIEEI